MSAHRTAAARKGGITARAWWPWLKRALTVLFFGVVGYLLYTQARSVEWGEVLETLRRRPASTLWPAAVLAACSYLLYSCFDLLGRRVTQHGLPVGQVMTVNFISYAFNLNMGSLVGGVAFRYRLYSRLGLDTATVTRVVALSMLTNWLGYLLLAGLAFTLTPPEPPADWKLGTGGLRLLGAGLLAAALAYVLLCAFSRRRDWSIRGHDIQLPSLRMALLQLLMSSANWLLIGGTVWLLLGREIAFGPVLAVLLVAAVAGVITHVPAGLGVLELVFVTLLSHEVPRNALLAALLAYRAIYYLGPLAIAALVYVVMELRARRAGGRKGG
ncbi:MAG TPA: lysylphosphatidylglycerol synthase domain-containing protein [Noviherbaspirillum sp.]|uniref:lysylphosphatidylglycerol synthase domain-containing protein n=1 Tax=Noviherbaspirillum sp. TaxID=1926288 RepID=UPI002F94EE45